MSSFTRVLVALSLTYVVASPTLAQQRGARSATGETADLARGWQLLSDGRPRDAAKVASQVLATNPRSGAGLSLAIEATVATSGSSTALGSYEQWLGKRTIEEPAALRRIARALLDETVAETRPSPARTVAVVALARDGDQRAARELESLRASGDDFTDRALAAAGDATAVAALASRLETAGGAEGLRALDALGASGDRSAAAQIAARLSDERTEIRAAAAEALGRLNAADYANALRELLNDRNTYVRIKAAGALVRLGDESGVSAAASFNTHEMPSVRLAAAEALAPRPTEEWKAQVRNLLSSDNAEVRIGAARLLAPYDPDAAFAALAAFNTSENPALRQLAERASGEIDTTDLTVLRHLLRRADALGKVRAAARVLAVTR